GPLPQRAKRTPRPIPEKEANSQTEPPTNVEESPTRTRVEARKGIPPQEPPAPKTYRPKPPLDKPPPAMEATSETGKISSKRKLPLGSRESRRKAVARRRVRQMGMELIVSEVPMTRTQLSVLSKGRSFVPGPPPKKALLENLGNSMNRLKEQINKRFTDSLLPGQEIEDTFNKKRNLPKQLPMKQRESIPTKNSQENQFISSVQLFTAFTPCRYSTEIVRCNITSATQKSSSSRWKSSPGPHNAKKYEAVPSHTRTHPNEKNPPNLIQGPLPQRAKRTPRPIPEKEASSQTEPPTNVEESPTGTRVEARKGIPPQEPPAPKTYRPKPPLDKPPPAMEATSETGKISSKRNYHWAQGNSRRKACGQKEGTAVGMELIVS
ncbi:serine/arginine repetitive matrix protein 1-like, partial [Penaeus indicus]|uniref:serine/arginine repetitive matrix protein 1-like n=1 Tax=Penaeus indicus TaxID=29960 RepID=UPI00300DA5E7